MMTQASVTNGSQRQKIMFKCTSSDQSPLLVIGDVPELGNWDPGQAIEMQCQTELQGGCEWTAVAEIPLGTTIEYKFIKKTDDGIRWESGFNHRHTVIPGNYTLTDAFRE
jgi:alpha-amylase